MKQFILDSNKSNKFLAYLERRKSHLDEKRNVLLDVIHRIQSQENNSAEDVIIHIGSGLYARKCSTDALDFIKRQICQISDALNKASIQLARQSGIENVRTTSLHDGAGTLSLPIVEIQEHIDNEGNIISTILNDELFFTNSQRPDDRSIFFDRIRDASTEMHDSSGPKADNEDLRGDDVNNDVQLDELFDNLEIMDLQDKRGDSTLGSSTASSYHNLTEADTQLSDSTNIYALEFIAGQLLTDDEVEVDCENFDYDFEDSDEDSCENEFPFDFVTNMDTSLLPGGSEASIRLRNDIIAHRRQRLEQASTSPSNTQRRVHFNDTLDIKEVENIGELQNSKHGTPKLLKFKKNNITKMSNRVDIKLSYILKKSGDVAHSYGGESHRDRNSSEVMSDVFERTYEVRVDDANEQCEKIAGFTKLGEDNSEGHNSVVKTALKNIPLCVLKSLFEPNSPGEERSAPEYQIDNPPERLNAPSSFNETKHAQIELNNLAQAYQRGDFDRDIQVTGPVVSKLDDFAVLNRIIDSMVSQDSTTSRRDSFRALHPTEKEECYSSESSDEIMVDRITEKKIGFLSVTDELHEVDDVEQYIIDREISEQYHRLRTKISSQRKSGSENGEFHANKNGSKFLSRLHAGARTT